MVFSPACSQLIAGFEGFRSKSYPDPASGGEPITIGYGSTHYCDGTKVTLQDSPVTQQQGMDMLLCFLNNNVLPNFHQHITSDITQCMLDSLGSLCYNIGDTNFDNSNLLKQIDANIQGNTLQPFWETWDHSGGQVVGGLLTRRQKEFAYSQSC